MNNSNIIMVAVIAFLYIEYRKKNSVLYQTKERFNDLIEKTGDGPTDDLEFWRNRDDWGGPY